VSEQPESSVTRLLHDWRGGDAGALEQVAALVNQELHRLAASYMGRERQGHTLQPTALVNEAYMRLMGQNEKVDWQSRSHFIAIAAQHMRQVLVDYARRHLSEKRGSGVTLIALDQADASAEGRTADLLALDEALAKLAQGAPRQARVMELKYFGGLQMAEIGEVLGVSLKTVEKDARVAGAWLRSALQG
jgi:RNA polymerase sigma factor (TIGR02999 family)